MIAVDLFAGGGGVEWANEIAPRVIALENVPEWLSWGPLDSDGQPIISRKGETFRAFVGALQLAGYRVEWRVLMRRSRSTRGRRRCSNWTTGSRSSWRTAGGGRGRWWPGTVVSVPYPLPRQQVHGEPSKYRDGLQRLDVVLDDKGQRSHRVVAHPFGVRKFTPARRAYGTAPLRTTEREPEPRSPTWPGGAECGFVAVLGTVRSKFGGALDAACRAAPVRTFTPHAIRYAVVRRYRKAGVDVATAADIFGHSIAVMLGIYNAIDPVDRADALALVSKFEAGEPKRAAGTVLRLKR